jgi:hypothetical protein
MTTSRFRISSTLSEYNSGRMRRRSMAKKVKTIKVKKVWFDKQWTVQFGWLNAGRGGAGGGKRLFRVIGEKLPFEALNEVNKRLRSQGVRREGVYVAQDSMGYARYIGRGRIFSRLRACREIETLLIHAAGPLLLFNTKKKRIDMSAGAIQDYEGGTKFFERRYKKGRKSF